MKKEEEKKVSKSWKLSRELLAAFTASDSVKNGEISPFSIMNSLGDFTASVLVAMQKSAPNLPDVYKFYRDFVLPAYYKNAEQFYTKSDKEKEVS